MGLTALSNQEIEGEDLKEELTGILMEILKQYDGAKNQQAEAENELYEASQLEIKPCATCKRRICHTQWLKLWENTANGKTPDKQETRRMATEHVLIQHCGAILTLRMGVQYTVIRTEQYV